MEGRVTQWKKEQQEAETAEGEEVKQKEAKQGERRARGRGERRARGRGETRARGRGERRARGRGERMEYVGMRFEGNGSKKWDGKEVEVARKTVVRLAEWTEEGLERAEVHWLGKGEKANKGKVWKCVVLLPESQSEAEVGGRSAR